MRPNTWESLPLEVWITIFAQIDSLKDLIQCRLVCKAWDPLAEKAVFSQTLHFSTERSTAVQLHHHLARKPFLGRCIKKVQIKRSSWGDNIKFTDPLMVELCKLVFTPEIEKIDGMLLDDDFYKLLLDIMNNSPQQFRHFKAITASPIKSLPYSQVLCKAKDTLEFMELDILHNHSPGQLVMDLLDKFVKLKEIALTLEFMTEIEAIDAILQKLQNVESLTLKMNVYSFSRKTETEMNAWLGQHVQKDETMKTVRLQEIGEMEYTPNLVDYVVHKYPKLETLALVITDMGKHLDKVFQSIGQIPHVRIFETFTEQPEDVWMLGYRFKSTANKIEIRYALVLTFDDEEGAEVAISRKNSTHHTDFVLSLTPDLPHAFAKQLLTSISTGTSDITELNINLYLYKDARDESEHGMSFYNILKMAPHIKILRFCDEKIEHQTTGLDTLTLNDLAHLQFYATLIGPGVLQHISKIAPNLRNLDLFSCFLLDEDKKYRRMIVDMPHSALERIAIKTGTHNHTEGAKRREIKKLASMEKKINSMNNVYLFVDTEDSSEQHFVLESGQNTITIISKDEYTLNSNGSKILHIHCKSLKELRIDIAGFDINMVWDGNGKLSSNSCIKESDYLILKREYLALQKIHDIK